MSQVDEMQVLKDALREVMSKLQRFGYDTDALQEGISVDLASQAIESPSSGAGTIHRSQMISAVKEANASAREFAKSLR